MPFQHRPSPATAATVPCACELPSPAVAHRTAPALSDDAAPDAPATASPDAGDDLAGALADAQRRLQERDGELARVRGRLRRAEAALAARDANADAGPAHATTDGVWHCDLASGRVHHSPRVRELLGYPAAEPADLAGRVHDLVHPDDWAALNAALRAHLDHDEPFSIEVRLRTRDGAWRWYWSRGRAERDAAGQPRRMAGSLSDVTERRRAEAARAAREAQLRAVLEHLPAGAVFLFDEAQRYQVATARRCGSPGSIRRRSSAARRATCSRRPRRRRWRRSTRQRSPAGRCRATCAPAHRCSRRAPPPCATAPGASWPAWCCRWT
jgi:PAS domain S-box-containing protein